MINFCLKRVSTVAAGLLLLCASCGDPDLFDTDKWSDNIEGLEPNMQLKVAHGSFTLWDLLMDTTGYIQKIPDSQNPADSVLAIRYEEKDIYHLNDLSTIFNMSIGDLDFNIPSAVIPGGGNSLLLTEDLSSDTVTLNSGVVIGETLEGTDLKEILASARLDISLPRADFNYDMTIIFDNLYVNGNLFSQTFSVSKKGVGNEGDYTTQIEWPGALLDLKKSKEIRMTAFALINKGQTIITGSAIPGGNVKLSQLDFIKAVGKIRTEPMTVQGNFDLDIDFLNKIDGKFLFAEPELKILVKNKGIGVAAELQMDFWVKDGLGINRFAGGPLAFPINRDTVAEVGIIGYHGAELAKFLSLPPSGLLSYEGEVTATGSEAGDDVIWKNGSIGLDAEISIPLKLSGELVYKDTLNDISIDADIADKIMGASIVLIAENGIQLALTLDSLTLLDADYNELTRVKATDGKDKLAAAVGREPAKGELDFGLSPDQAKLLGRTEHILLNIKASSPVVGGVSQPATVYSDATLDLNVMVKAQIKLNNFDF